MAKKWYWCGRGTRTVKSEKKCGELKKGLTAVQIQLSEILTNKNLFVPWVWLKSQQCFFVILWYTKVDSNARLLKISFIKCLWSPSWKNSYCPSTKTLWEWIGQSVWSQSQQEFAGQHSCSLEEPPEKALTGDSGALIGKWADLQKRWTVALLHYSSLFQVRNNEKNDYF